MSNYGPPPGWPNQPYQPPQGYYGQPNQYYQPNYSQSLPPYQPPPQPPKKWYQSSAGIILLLFLFFPIGLYLMWKHAPWPPIIKVAVTGVLAFGVLVNASTLGTASQTAPTTAVTTATNQATPTPVPTQPPKTWEKTHTYSGDGVKKTEIIDVADEWALGWACAPSSFYGGQYNVIVTVIAPDTTPIDLAVNTICRAGNVGGQTQEHKGGRLYLDISSEAAWTVVIQELK